MENGSCDSLSPQCNTSGPEEINFIEVKVKALPSVLTTFLPIETAWNVCKDSIHTGYYTPGYKKKKKTSNVSTGNYRCLSEIIPAKPLQMCDAWNYADGWNWRGNRDRSAFAAIDCCPLAQLNETLHLYDKQLHLIQPLVFCCPSICLSFGDVVTLSVICILGFSFPSHRRYDIAFSFQAGVK